MSRHWSDDLRETLQSELSSLSDAGKGVFGELRPPKKAPSPLQRAREFLNMDTMQRQMLALELGPEGYKEFVDERMNDTISLLGPGAANLYPYFAQDLQPDQTMPDVMQEMASLYDDGLDEDEV